MIAAGAAPLVLVLRPRAQAERTAERLAALGHPALIEPVLEIRPLPPPALDTAGIAVVAVTSAHAAFALAGLPAALPVHAVGAATAAAAERVLGRAVRVAQGDGAALAEAILRDLPEAAGEVLHLAGREVSPGLAATLAAAGCRCRRLTVYEAVPTGALSPICRAALSEGAVGAVLLHSPRSARLWLAGVAAAGLVPALARLRAVCLSPAVAAALGDGIFAGVRVAAEPSEAALLRCLDAPARK